MAAKMCGFVSKVTPNGTKSPLKKSVFHSVCSELQLLLMSFESSVCQLESSWLAINC